jgi:hypothetical protein
VSGRLPGETACEKWQRLVDTKVTTDLDEIQMLCLPDRWSEYENSLVNKSIDEIITTIGEHPEDFPVDFGRLLFFVPDNLGPGSKIDIFLEDFAGIPEQTEMLTRLQIIYGLVERLNFCFYATARGDIVCEMPLYSFKPEDFGSYQDRYKFTMEDMISYSSHFQHDKVRTLLQADFAIIPGFASLSTQEKIWIAPKVVAVQALIPQFGLVAEKAEPWHFANSVEAMKYYCDLKLAQLNGDAWTQNVQTVIRMGLGPNRPCYFEARDFIATLRSISNAIRWQKDGAVSQTLSVNYRRGWTGQVADDKVTHLYEPYGGIMADPTAIAVLFQESTNPVKTSTKEAAPVTQKAYWSQYKNELSTDEQKQLERNLQATREVETKIVARFTEEFGIPLTRADLIGSEYRNPSEQALLVKKGSGSTTSLHPHGLAFDIPQSKLDALYARTGRRLTRGQEGALIGESMGPSVQDAIYHHGHWHIELKIDEAHRRLRHTKKD